MENHAETEWTTEQYPLEFALVSFKAPSGLLWALDIVRLPACYVPSCISSSAWRISFDIIPKNASEWESLKARLGNWKLPWKLKLETRQGTYILMCMSDAKRFMGYWCELPGCCEVAAESSHMGIAVFLASKQLLGRMAPKICHHSLQKECPTKKTTLLSSSGRSFGVLSV